MLNHFYGGLTVCTHKVAQTGHHQVSQTTVVWTSTCSVALSPWKLVRWRRCLLELTDHGHITNIAYSHACPNVVTRWLFVFAQGCDQKVTRYLKGHYRTLSTLKVMTRYTCMFTDCHSSTGDTVLLYSSAMEMHWVINPITRPQLAD